MEAIRPAAVVVEEVPGFAGSGAAAMVKGVLRTLGYRLHEGILDAHAFGSLTKRRRYCLVAVAGDGFALPRPPGPSGKRVADVLEAPPQERRWVTAGECPSVATMLRRSREHARRGHGFRMGAVGPEATACPTISKGIAKRRLTDPILADGAGRFSWFTPRELARINGLPDDFVLPDAKTRACEVVGQGVAYEPFRAVADALRRWFGAAEEAPAS